MKNIVVPIDFSPFSESAAKAGVFFARKTGAQLHLLHVANAPADWNALTVAAQQEYPEIESRMVEAEIKLEKFAEKTMFKGIGTHTYVYAGNPYEQIVQFIEAYHMDLVVMGAHGAGETSGLFMGSTAQRVIRTAPCPVLSVKKNYTPKAIRKILFPSDFNERYLKQFDTITKVASITHASVDLLFINTPADFTDSETSSKRMNKFILPQGAVKVKPIVYNAVEREPGILNFSSNHPVDMIAMVTHNRKGRPNYQLGITETVLFHTDAPVLSMVER